MKIAAVTDIGKCRTENQDNYCARQLADGGGWGIVCDGMGGANGGRIASGIATDTLCSYFVEKMDSLHTGQEETFILQGFDIANKAVYEKATSSADMFGMGTTSVCAYLSRGIAHIVHAGDSRAYLIRKGTMTQLTRDHSMVQQLVDSGKITLEEAAQHPQKNLITRALGVGATIVPEYDRCPIQDGDVLMLCTDGLTNMVSDAEIELIMKETPFFEAPYRLVDRAMHVGGQDNITILLLGVEATEDVTHG